MSVLLVVLQLTSFFSNFEENVCNVRIVPKYVNCSKIQQFRVKRSAAENIVHVLFILCKSCFSMSYSFIVMDLPIF